MRFLALVPLVLAPLALTPAASAAWREAPTPGLVTSYTHVANLDDYWNGTASWKLAHYYSQAAWGQSVNDGGFGAGPTIVVGPDGAWDWFYRTSEPDGAVEAPCTGAAAGGDNEFVLAGTLVRRSTDKGSTWSDPTNVVLPAAGTPWACQATDGSAIWDGSRWNYVFQCLASQSSIVWHGCLATNSSPDPTAGTWVADLSTPGANPILGDDVANAKLWDKICDDPADDCVRIPNDAGGDFLLSFPQTGVNKVGAAGTFNLFRNPADPSYIYMDFHGVDSAFGYQYMGVAKTQDFHTWVAKGAGLPSDAIYDRLDSRSWHEPADPLWDQRVHADLGETYGGGGSAVFPDPVTGRFYNLADASNAPVCTQATVFDQGILRSNTLTSTTWEQPTAPGRENPILYSEQSLFTDELTPGRCSPSYASMFNDPDTGETYLLYYGRSSQDVAGDYLFKLQNNVLLNSDASRCVDTAPWHSAGGNHRVWRDGVWAADGMCYFAFEEPIWQDVTLPAGRTWSSLEWGGSFSSRTSVLQPPMGFKSLAATGAAQLTLTQYNALGGVVSTTNVPVSLGGAYGTTTTTTTVSPSTTRVRYTVSPQSLGLLVTVLADQMFLRPQ